ncbi:MAG: anti-sigma factor antagonist [Candidatus Hydrogenedentota bacterium]|nr:MAG: anti-sigma factor antagonist [Candidatus Hydrogenedentota bacterium]
MISKKEVNGVLLLTVEQERVDMVISRQFKEELLESIQEKPANVILNLSNVQYLDSSALGTLVAFLREIKKYGGTLKLCSLSSTLMTLMSLSKLDAMFKIYDTCEEALGS